MTIRVGQFKKIQSLNFELDSGSDVDSATIGADKRRTLEQLELSFKFFPAGA